MKGEAATGDDDDLLAPPPIDLLPWHAAACDRLSGALGSGRLSHGLLLQGPAGVGKGRFASALAAAYKRKTISQASLTSWPSFFNCP